MDILVDKERMNSIIEFWQKKCADAEAENAELKALIAQRDESITAQAEIILKLKAENDKLKALCDTYKTCYQAKHSDIKCLFIKYKQTLQEIKAIAENIINNDDKPACVNDKECPLNDGDGFDNHCNMRCPFILGKQILDLITKAEEE